MDEIYDLGKWIQYKRKLLDITVRQLTERVNYSESYLHKIETGERPVSMALAEQLAEVFQLDHIEREWFLNAVLREDGKTVPPTTRLSLSMVGYRREVDQIIEHLQTHPDSVLTLTGKIGSGKTTLAQYISQHQAMVQKSRIYFVNLQNQPPADRTIEAIHRAIVDCFDIDADAPDVWKQIAMRLRKPNLLILDGCEYVALQVGEWLRTFRRHAPRCSVLVTSLCPLGIDNERVIMLDGLEYPPVNETDFLRYDAVQLFVQRAIKNDTLFKNQPIDYEPIAKICRFVKGHPLTIELAARWTHIMSLHDIAAKITTAPDFLTENVQNLPPRWRSMQGVLDYISRLITRDEYEAVVRLSVFSGTFDSAGAAIIVRTTPEILQRLVAVTLLKSVEDNRYEIASPMRFTLSRLFTELPDADEIRRRHADHYLLSILSYAQEHTQADEGSPYHFIDREYDNVRAALLYHAHQGAWHKLYAVFDPIWGYFCARNRFDEALDLIHTFESILKPDLSSQQGKTVMVTLLAGQIWFHIRLGQIESALAKLKQAQNYPYEPDTFPHSYRAFGLLVRGYLHEVAGHTGIALDEFLKGVALAQDNDDATVEAYLRYYMIFVWLLMGRNIEGLEACRIAQNMAENLRITWMIPYIMRAKAQALTACGEFEQADAILQAALDRFLEAKDQAGWLISVGYLVAVKIKQRQVARAARLIVDGLRRVLDTQFYVSAYVLITQAGYLYYQLGESQRGLPLLNYVHTHPSLLPYQRPFVDNVIQEIFGLQARDIIELNTPPSVNQGVRTIIRDLFDDLQHRDLSSM